MSQPGWFPDPAGQPGHFRYWDGQQWASTTSTIPGASSSNASSPKRRPVALWIAALTVLTIVVVLIVRSLGGASPAAEDTNTSTPTVSAWDETSTPTPGPPTRPSPSGAQVVACPDNAGGGNGQGEQNGRFSGGGLSYAAIPGWEDRNGWGVDWATDRAGQRDSVTSSWVAIAVVGEVDKDAFVSPEQAARGLISCLASSYYYKSITQRVNKSSAEVTVDGVKGWKAVTEIYVSDRPGVKGDVIQVVVVDIGREGKLSIMVTEAPIGDQDRLTKTDAAIASLRIEG